ncbi:heme oxygenase (biliverdin-producing) [Catenulispora pinisilvae]|uniref:biliverdin-producing heme oxygenase n=1 Tax=Catenulispora pinisilvae TaxID=2705253 RepID=UPI001891566D|nr:biliverdin-producing heme oxygenase [Catenulispora pinisilvae]
MTETATGGFAALLRTASAAEHEKAEASPFVGDLLGGRLGVEAYSGLAGQLWFVYRELERAAGDLAGHPVVGAFVDPALFRTAALEQDLRHLHGPAWRERLVPLAATEAYVARVRGVARDWPAGYVAHHYTRYLGDLSGGQVIRDAAEKSWGFQRKGDGVRFYVFDEIGNVAAYKRAYRAKLDAMAADEVEQRRIAQECKRAFRLNSALFQDLGRCFPPAA